MSDWQSANASPKGGSGIQWKISWKLEKMWRDWLSHPLLGSVNATSFLARIRQCIMKLKMYMPWVPAVPLQDIYLTEMRAPEGNNMCAGLFIAVLCAQAKH